MTTLPPSPPLSGPTCAHTAGIGARSEGPQGDPVSCGEKQLKWRAVGQTATLRQLRRVLHGGAARCTAFWHDSKEVCPADLAEQEHQTLLDHSLNYISWFTPTTTYRGGVHVLAECSLSLTNQVRVRLR